MEPNKNVIIADLKRLSNLLDAQYASEFNFRNHCYLRIAYDNTVQDKWDNVVKRPFNKYAKIDQLQNAIHLMTVYKLNKEKLLTDNEKSLAFRKEDTELKSATQITLFNNL